MAAKLKAEVQALLEDIPSLSNETIAIMLNELPKRWEILGAAAILPNDALSSSKLWSVLV